MIRLFLTPATALLQCRFTRDAALLQRVGQVLLQHPTTQKPKPLARFKPRWLVAKDAFALADPAATQAIYDVLAGPRFKGVQAVLGAPSEVEVAGAALATDGLQELSSWVEAFRITQVRLGMIWHVLSHAKLRADSDNADSVSND
jgi:hypothetical protein